ncbi:MAG: hypothetical protein AAB415_03180 [Patescibacteria group bacterium]
MVTQMVLKIDNKLKQAAPKHKPFLASELAVTFAPTLEIPNSRTARSLRAALKDVKLGRNLSPRFDNAKDAIAYLEKYAG